MERRGFIKFCGASAAALGVPEVSADAQARFYSRARLVDEKGVPLRAAAVPANRNLIFHYPFAATPCFLLNLGKPAKGSARLKTVAGEPYEWKGGVGAERSVVAYSAICAHRLAYPTRDITFISYRSGKSASKPHRQRDPLLRRAQPVRSRRRGTSGCGPCAAAARGDPA